MDMNEPREASIWRQGDRWIGFSAKMDEETNDGKGIQTSVQDHGVGTNSSDSPQIFEPLYRSSPAIAAQIHGTELGLSIAKRNAEAFGRNLSVVSEAGVGSVSTLRLRAWEHASEMATITPRTNLGISLIFPSPRCSCP